MTDTTQGQDANRGRFEPRITQHFYNPGDRRPQPQPRTYYDAPRDPYAMTTGGILALVFGVLGAVGLVALLLLGGNLTCDANCWQAKKTVAIAEQTTIRAVANSDANSRAGFGNDDFATGQFAVSPPARTVIREPRPEVVTPAPCCAVAAPAPRDRSIIKGKPGDPDCFTLPNGNLRCPNHWAEIGHL